MNETKYNDIGLSPVNVSERKEFSGIGVGLVFVVLHLMLTIIYQCVNFLQILLYPINSAVFMDRASTMRTYLFITVDFLILALVFYNLLLLFRRDGRFVRNYKILIIFLLLTSALHYFLINASEIFYYGYFSWSDLFQYLWYPVGLICVFFPYFKYSQKVRGGSGRYSGHKENEGFDVSTSSGGDESTQKKLTGIGGWLTVIVIQLVVVLIYNAFGLFDKMSNPMSTSPIAIDNRMAIGKGTMDFFFALGFIGDLLMALIALFSLYALLRRKLAFKKYYRLFLYFSFLYPLLFATWCFWYQKLIAYSFSWGVLILFFAYPVVMTYLCFPYLKLSRRVKLTFINYCLA